MKKSWRNPRQVIVHQASTEPGDARRRERLISLLAIGMERLVSEKTKNDISNRVDFPANVLVNTRNLE